jgi:probable phosphoglycerate mutase
MARWYLVRHGQTDWNLEGRVQGHSDTPLNGEGRRQAGLLAARLQAVEFSIAYSSDLGRAVETAEAVLTRSRTDLNLLSGLREKSYGEIEGKTFRELEKDSPDLFKNLLVEDDLDFAPPGGESDLQMFHRVRETIEQIRDGLLENDNVLIASHGGALRAAAMALLGLPENALWRFLLSNGSLSIVSTYPRNAVLELWNDTSHLEASDG